MPNSPIDPDPETDLITRRLCVAGVLLIATVSLALIGYLAYQSRPIPESLVGAAGTAIGALVTLLGRWRH